MATDDDLLSLVGDIYDAAVDPSLWYPAMERLLAATDCQGATFCVLDSREARQLPLMITVNFDPTFIKEYQELMAPYDPTIQAIVAHPAQKIFHDSPYITEREKDRHLYYDWHRRSSDTRHRIAGMVTPAPGIQSGVTVHRTRQKGDFDAASKERTLMLFRHIERAVQIGFRLGTLGAVQESLLAGLDNNPRAIFFLDKFGHVILANGAANEVLQAADGVRLTEGVLKLVSVGCNDTLQGLVTNALKAGTHAVATPGGAMSALRPSGRRAYAIMVSPLSPASFALTAVRPAVCVVIADPEKRVVPPLESLRAIFALTPSEARLAQRLAQGDDLYGAASALGITYGTARVQLASVFRKTRTRRQGELVRLLLTTLPALGS